MRQIMVYLYMCMLVCLFGAGSACAESQGEHQVFHQVFTYGASELGRSLECHARGADSAERSLLLIFGVHGFEDEYDHDGEILNMIAEHAYAIDIHGWIEASYGSGRMADVFAKAFGVDVKIPQSGGMLCLWLNKVTEESIMIEMPYNPNKEQYVLTQSSNLIKGIDHWIAIKSDSDK